MTSGEMPDLFAELERASKRAELRMRLSRVLDAAVTHLFASLVASSIAVAAHRLKAIEGWLLRDLLIAAGLQIVLGIVWAATRKLPRLAGAMALDAHHGLSGRIANALAFSELPETSRTPFVRAAIEDACEHAERLSPRAAVRLSRPRHLWAMSASLAVFVGLLVLPERAEKPAPLALPTETTIEPAVLAEEDVALFLEVGRELAQRERSEEVIAAARALERLVEEIADQRLDRVEAFGRLHEMEKALSQGRALGAEALEEQLRERARALRRSPRLVPLAEALERRDFVKAEEALRELAKRLREQPEGFDRRELERLREAMKKAAETQGERLSRLQKEREELLKRLREGEEGEERLLRREERRLESLSREIEEAEQAERRLERLDRELSQAAEDLARELGLSADSLERAAEDINRMARERMSEEDREELLQRLRDLREQLRQQGPGDEKKRLQLRRFARMARGQGPGQGQEGEGQGQGQGEGDEGEGQGRGRGQGKGNEGELFVEGPGGEKMLVLQRGGTSSGPGEGPGGTGAGQGHDPRWAGKPKEGSMETTDVQAMGLDSGQGVTRSEVIQGASGRGFRGRGYQRVYTEYRTVAEEQLKSEEIPPGAGTHVRRYFDLIRPRD